MGNGANDDPPNRRRFAIASAASSLWKRLGRDEGGTHRVSVRRVSGMRSCGRGGASRALDANVWLPKDCKMEETEL